MKSLLVILSLLFSHFFAFAQTSTANVNLSQSTVFDAEPYIAINPVNKQNIVVAWIGFSLKYGTSIKTRCSFDGGKSWSAVNTLPHYGKTWHSADPSMAFFDDRHLYVSYIDYRENPDSGGVYVALSSDGGKNWSPLAQVWDARESAKLPFDRPWLVAGPGMGSSPALYMTTKPAPWIPAPNRPYFKYSTDGGKNWSPYRFLDSANWLVGKFIQAPMAAPTIMASGHFAAVYPSYVATQNIKPQIVFVKKNKSKLDFSYNKVFDDGASVTDTLYKLGYRLIANPKDSNRLNIFFIDQRKGDADVYTISSHDGGKTWGNEVRVNDDATANGKGQDLVWADYDDKGRIVIAWRDRRNAPGVGYEQPSEIYGTYSLDSGKSFKKNFRISDTTVAYDKVLAANGNDFLCTAAVNDTMRTVWGDVRSGKLNVYYATTSIMSGSSSIQRITQEELQGLHLWPNPAKGMINLSFYNDESQQCRIEIMDINGKVLKNYPSRIVTSGIQQLSIDLGGLAKGQYICRVIGKEGALASPFVVY